MRIETSLKHWLCETVLPFWAREGLDEGTGLFQERLLPDGAPDAAAIRRVRVQARQVYVYAHAAVLGWYPEGGALALRVFDRLVSLARAPDGAPGFVHTLTPEGQVANPLRDTYDHAFIVLACAWLLRATNEPRVRRVLEETLAFADAALTAPDGSLLEGFPASLPRRQNPQMHWFEAMLALAEALGHPEALRRAAWFRHLFEAKLYDRAGRCLGEYFADDWTPAPGEAGLIVEPGHQAEWVWLLRRHESLGGLARGRLASELLEATLPWIDPAIGLLVDEGGRRGETRRATRRSWLQTELAKAWIAEAECGRPGAAARARAALTMLDRHYLRQPLPAGWVDQLDEQVRPIPGPIPASTLYHIFVAILEGERVLAAPARRVMAEVPLPLEVARSPLARPLDVPGIGQPSRS